MSYEFDTIDFDDVGKESARLGTSRDNTPNFLDNIVKMPEKSGFVNVRILPPKKGSKKFYCSTRLHKLTNPLTGKSRTFHCARSLQEGRGGIPQWKQTPGEEDCIVCKYYSKLWQDSERMSGAAMKAKQDEARALKPYERFYYNVIVRSEKDKDGNVIKNAGPKIFSCGKKQHAKILNGIFGNDELGEKPLGNVTHPEKGRDFKIIQKVTPGSEFPTFDESKFEEPSLAGTSEEIERWMGNLHDLQALRNIKSKDELTHQLKIHLGMVKEEVEDDDLAQFSVGHTEPVKNVSHTIKEDLVSGKEAIKKEEDDIIADDDFLNNLDSIG